MSFEPFNLAMGQLYVEGGNKEANLARAVSMIAEAAKDGCEMIVLPECLDLGWTHPSAHQLAENIPGRTSERLCRSAEENHIFVIAGLTEREGSRIFNSALLIDPSGEILLKHRKINVLSIAQDIYSIGDSLGVVETRFGTIGIDICADNFPSSLAIGHTLARMGAHFILSPSAWAVEADFDNEKTPYGEMWKESYRTLARLYGMTIAGVSNVGVLNAGVWKGKKAIGCSLAIGPDEEILAEGPYGEEAEALIKIKVQASPREVKGTDYADHLKKKGYEGP